MSVAALVEGGHWLVCRAGLKLHEIGTRMFAFGTWLCSRVNILPGSCSTKHIIHFFKLRILPICYLAGDVVHIGAGVASETVAALALLHDQPVPAARAEEQHNGRIGPAGSRQPPRPVGRRPYAHLELTLVRASPSAHQ